MSNPIHDDPVVQTPPARGRLSPLAVVAVVLAAVPMCVPVNLLGFIFGVVALRRIRLAAGTMRGAGAARAAMVLGVVTTLGGSWGWMTLQEWQESMTMEVAATTANGFVLAAAGHDSSKALTWWSPQTDLPSLEDISAFGKTLTAAGAVSHVIVNAVTPAMDGDFFRPTMSLWLTIACSNGHSWRGSARLDLLAQSGEFTPRGGLRWIEIELPEGTISVGQRPAETEANAGT